jgi:hypothetical protein
LQIEQALRLTVVGANPAKVIYGTCNAAHPRLP